MSDGIPGKISDIITIGKSIGMLEKRSGPFHNFHKLAWLITVHKSQRLTFDAVTLDIGGNAFAPGLAYVAVSRCRSLDGLRLHSRIRPSDVKVDPHARQFYIKNRKIDKS